MKNLPDYLIDKSCTTNDNYWDCECEENYIHSKEFTYCPKCNSVPFEMPDSREGEIKYGYIPEEETGKRFNHQQVNFDLEKLYYFDEIEIKKSCLDTKENGKVWTIDVNDECYIYPNKKECKEDYEALKKVLPFHKQPSQ